MRIFIFLTLGFFQFSQAIACALSEDTIILNANGKRVTDASSFMIESEKNGSYSPWTVCNNAICKKRRGQASASGGPDDAIICRLPDSKTALTEDEWENLDTDPTQVCRAGEVADDPVTRNKCIQDLYSEFNLSQSRQCQKILISLTSKDIGLRPNNKVPVKKPGPGQNCFFKHRCLRVDVVKKTVQACSSDEMKN